MSDVKLVTLKCPNCGGSLSVGSSTLTFACEYCGSTVAVEQGGEGATLRLLSEGLARVERGTDKVAAEHAIPRITEELRTARKERAAREELRGNEEQYRAYALAEAKFKPVRELLRTVVILFAGWFGSVFVLSAVHRFLHPDGERPDADWKLIIGPGALLIGIAVTVSSVLKRAGQRRSTRKRVKAEREEAERRKQTEHAEFDRQIKDLEKRLADKRRIADS